MNRSTGRLTIASVWPVGAIGYLASLSVAPNVPEMAALSIVASQRATEDPLKTLKGVVG